MISRAESLKIQMLFKNYINMVFSTITSEFYFKSSDPYIYKIDEREES